MAAFTLQPQSPEVIKRENSSQSLNSLLSGPLQKFADPRPSLKREAWLLYYVVCIKSQVTLRVWSVVFLKSGVRSSQGDIRKSTSQRSPDDGACSGQDQGTAPLPSLRWAFSLVPYIYIGPKKKWKKRVWGCYKDP